MSLVLLSRRAPADPDVSNLRALSRSSERPDECRARGASKSAVWDRAKTPGTGPYCEALALGYSLLTTEPARAAEQASLAERALPGHAAPSILAARALAARGDDANAFAAFEEAKARDPRSLDKVSTLLDYAHAALATHHVPEALAAYRTLVPRVALLATGDERARALIEAAALAMQQGKGGLAEATGELSEARVDSTAPELLDTKIAALALALRRQGRAAEASDVAKAADGPFRLEAERERVVGGKGRPLLALPPGELDAMIAVLAETHDRELAIDRWTSYLDTDAGKHGPYAADARAARDAISRGARRTP